MSADAGDPAANSRESELAEQLDRLLLCDGAARTQALTEIAARDPARARELEELLVALPDPELVDGGESDEYLGEPGLGGALGGCVLESVIGRGGVGTVFAARPLEPPPAGAVKGRRGAPARARPRRR